MTTTTTTAINAIIEKVEITAADHNMLTVCLGLQLEGGAHQSISGHCLYSPDAPDWLDAGQYVWHVLRAAGVTEWSRLAGRAIRVRRHNGLICEIGHIIRDDLWFAPSRDGLVHTTRRPR